ncbi:MAG: WYL domain-containing protein [Lachnospiraceae bacterium]|nr:WYL domain-containing protein [Lachnospiraceae bacterium]
MAKGKNQKFKLYQLYKFLLRKTDDKHSVTMKQIQDELEKHEITADRKSLYNDIEETKILGIKVEGYQEGRNYYYHVIEKQFELAELKLLVDAIQSAKFISKKKSNNLIKKLEEFASEYEAKELQRQVVMSGRVKTMNESIYYNVDEIHSAIGENRRITFNYWKWNLDKEMELKKDGSLYEVSPWALCWDDENYYLIAFDEKNQKIKHYRVDKMKNITMIDERRNGRDYFEQFDVAEYMKRSFGMFGGDTELVKLKVRNDLVGVIIDRFGKDITIFPDDKEHFIVHVKVDVSNQFFAWVFGLGTGIEIVGPKKERDKMVKYLKDVNNLY